LQSLKQRLDAAARGLRGQDPHHVLQRGYAWVESADGRPVVSALALKTGQPVRAVWADGRAGALITDIEPLPPSA
jgi:exodeoxyribonuclease VII large subunit